MCLEVVGGWIKCILLLFFVATETSKTLLCIFLSTVPELLFIKTFYVHVLLPDLPPDGACIWKCAPAGSLHSVMCCSACWDHILDFFYFGQSRCLLQDQEGNKSPGSILFAGDWNDECLSSPLFASGV